MKKNSRFLVVMIASLYAISSTVSLQAAEMPIQEIEVDYAPPVLSVAQVRELKNNFVSWLGKHYRCLFAGKCTRAEKAQVTAEWGRWIKRLGLTVVVGLAAYFMRAHSQATVKGLSKAATEGILEAVIEAVDQKILAGVSLTPQQRIALIQQLFGDMVDIAKKRALDIQPGDDLPDWMEDTIRRLLDEIETRELQTPLGRVSVAPKRRDVSPIDPTYPGAAAAAPMPGTIPSTYRRAFGIF